MINVMNRLCLVSVNVGHYILRSIFSKMYSGLLISDMFTTLALCNHNNFTNGHIIKCIKRNIQFVRDRICKEFKY